MPKEIDDDVMPWSQLGLADNYDIETSEKKSITKDMLHSNFFIPVLLV